MAISYKKLWKLLIDRDMKKKDLMANGMESSKCSPTFMFPRKMPFILAMIMTT